MPVTRLPYPLRVGDAPLIGEASEVERYGEARELVNVRWRHRGWETRGGSRLVLQHRIQNTSAFSDEQALKSLANIPVDGTGRAYTDHCYGAYSFRYPGVQPIFVTVCGVYGVDKAVEVVALTPGRVLASLPVYQDEAITGTLASFVQMGRSLYIAGPFSRGLVRLVVGSTRVLDLDYLKVEDRTRVAAGAFDDRAEYLTRSPVFHSIVSYEGRVYGIDHEIRTRLRSSNRSDGDAYPGLNFHDERAGGGWVALAVLGRYLIGFKSGRIYAMTPGIAVAGEGGSSQEIDNPYHDGPVSSRAVVESPIGLIFQGRHGQYVVTPELRVVQIAAGHADLSASPNRRGDGHETYSAVADLNQLWRVNGTYDRSSSRVVFQVPGATPGATATSHGWFGLCYSVGSGDMQPGGHLDEGQNSEVLFADDGDGTESWIYGVDVRGRVKVLEWGTADHVHNDDGDPTSDTEVAYVPVRSLVRVVLRDPAGGDLRASWLELELEPTAVYLVGPEADDRWVLAEVRYGTGGVPTDIRTATLARSMWSPAAGTYQQTLGLIGSRFTARVPYLPPHLGRLSVLSSVSGSNFGIFATERLTARLGLQGCVGRSVAIDGLFQGRLVGVRADLAQLVGRSDRG